MKAQQTANTAQASTVHGYTVCKHLNNKACYFSASSFFFFFFLNTPAIPTKLDISAGPHYRFSQEVSREVFNLDTLVLTNEILQ